MGNLLFKICVTPLFYLLSILPFWLLYRLSDLLYVVTYLLVGYRKKVVTENLINSFPEKSKDEIVKIRSEFYKHFCDVIVETIKLLTMSEKTFKKRCSMSDVAVHNFMQYLGNGQTAVGIAGHCSNWEWTGVVIQVYLNKQSIGVYHPLANKNFDSLVYHLRSRFGGDLIPMKQLLKHILSLKQQNIHKLVGLLADQTPPPESAYWTKFLNQDTPVFNGPEKISKKFNYPIVYLTAKKIKRGYYQYDSKVLVHDPKSHPDGEISEIHTKFLEAKIKEQPSYWLWSHRRWKHKRPINI